jgi:purine-cytosine permease-like protein
MKNKDGMTNWKTDVKNWDKITNETASLILDQSETVLKETVETAKTISEKTDRLMSILLPIASAILIYLIRNIYTYKLNFLNISGGLIFCVICISLWYCYKNFRHYNIAIPGFPPKDILISKLIDNGFNESQQYINMIMTLCENIQDRIELNTTLNTSRSRNNRIALKWLFAIPVCPMVSAVFLFLCQGCHFVLP